MTYPMDMGYWFKAIRNVIGAILKRVKCMAQGDSFVLILSFRDSSRKVLKEKALSRCKIINTRVLSKRVFFRERDR